MEDQSPYYSTKQHLEKLDREIEYFLNAKFELCDEVLVDELLCDEYDQHQGEEVCAEMDFGSCFDDQIQEFTPWCGGNKNIWGSGMYSVWTAAARSNTLSGVPNI